MGQLFIGNSTATEVFCSINEGPRRALPPCSESPEPPLFTRYFPYFLQVNRKQVPGPGVPGFGDNKLTVRFESDPPHTYEFDVPVRKTYLLERDIIAVVFQGLLLLMEDTGNPLIPGKPVIPSSGTECSQEDNQSQR